MSLVSLRRACFLALCAMLGCCALTACGGQSSVTMPSLASTSTSPAPRASATAIVTAGPAQGAAIFQGQVPIEGFVACKTCHVTDPAAPAGVGPNLAGIATRGAERIQGLAAPEYIGRSIRVHDEYVVAGYAPGIAKAVVGRDFAEVLSESQVQQLVAYLMTLDDPPVAAEAAGGVALNTEPSTPTLPRPSPARSPTPVPTGSATPATSPTPVPTGSATPAASATLAPSATGASATDTPLPTSAPPTSTSAASATAAPTATSAAATDTPLPTSAPPTSTSAPAPTATTEPSPVPTPTPAAPPPAAATPTAAATAEALPSAPDDPELARYAPCVTCHNQHPLQVAMPHPLNPTCNECHRGAPNRIGCPSCHSMHGVEYHDPDPNLPCATCHT